LHLVDILLKIQKKFDWMKEICASDKSVVTVRHLTKGARSAGFAILRPYTLVAAGL
jgi:hypothetical protein